MATIVDQDYPDAARQLAVRFFGVSPEFVTTVGEAYEKETWASGRTVAPAPDLSGEVHLFAVRD